MDIDSKPPKKPLSPLSPHPIEGLEEALTKEEMEKEDGPVNLDNLIGETDLLVIEVDLDLDDLSKNLIKALITRGPVYQERPLAKIK